MSKTCQLHHLVFVTILPLMQMCGPSVENYTEKTIREDIHTVKLRSDKIRENTPIELADGLKLTLWATDSLAPDPIALSVDDYGKVYLTRTNRAKNSEFDIRGHRDWMIESISLKSVEERRAFLRKTFATENSNQNSWLEDLNKDGIHDWRDLTVEKDEVWRLADEKNNGVADVSTRILDDFNEEISDVAGALLVRRNDIFVGIGPDMWRITDINSDGVIDTKVSISHGYGVHIGFGGHGMSGAIEGPDGKIYWGIGDIGANIKTADGREFNYPNQGILVRSNPDGSDFEVFAAGLRNTHEFVFDEYGNIIGADNDGDHPGESERLIYIVDGSDAGWRANWQYGKYTDPRNNSYKVWMDEKLFVPRWEGQAVYIIPPITNYHNGPAGMTYNPGTALGKQWQHKFFLVEFVGMPSRSPVWSFSLRPKGASFELAEEEKVVQGILPTGIEFGPDGALYIADWINGWGPKNYGRVWRLDVENSNNDLGEERKETQRLMQLDYEDQDGDDLYQLLFYPDMRIRQKAQFELTDRGLKSMEYFEEAIGQTDNQLARIHGIWGVGQLARLKNGNAQALASLLNDSDPEIIAQSAKVIGEVKYQEAAEQLTPLLSSKNYRVRFFAAQALGHLKYIPAINPLLDMIEQNADEDVYIRHTGVLALSRIGEVNPIIALENHSSKSLRLAAVLVLRKIGDKRIALFLDDEDEYIVTETARAINDDWSIDAALPSLAALLNEAKFSNEPLIRRAINAGSRIGGNTEIDGLIAFAENGKVSATMRAEALAVLGNWSEPSVLDRVDGRFRGKTSRDASYVIANLTPQVGQILHSKDPTVLTAVAETITSLGIKDYMGEQYVLAKSHSSPSVRAAMITSLVSLDYADKVSLVKMGMNDESEEVRTIALGTLGELDIPAKDLPAIVQPILKKGTLKEHQELLQVLAEMPLENTSDIFKELASEWIAGRLDPGISLDLVEAIDSTKSVQLIQLIEPYRSEGNTTADFKDALYGGDGRMGRLTFFTNQTAQCVRCHSWDNAPGGVGPSLGGIADKLSREELLEALIEPSARLAPGFGNVTLTLTDGSMVSGILMEENPTELLLKTTNAEPLEISVKRIAKRENLPSAMPVMGLILTRREIRDLVEFLSMLKQQ